MIYVVQEIETCDPQATGTYYHQMGTYDGLDIVTCEQEIQTGAEQEKKPSPVWEIETLSLK